jgi:hypothetical protein
MSWRAFSCSVVLVLGLREGEHPRSMTDFDLAMSFDQVCAAARRLTRANIISVRIATDRHGVGEVMSVGPAHFASEVVRGLTCTVASPRVIGGVS